MALKDKYPSLFRLSSSKFAKLDEILCFENGVWRWRRELFDWEKEAVDELISCLSITKLIHGRVDEWRWSCDKSGKFNSRNAYEILGGVKILARRIYMIYCGVRFHPLR